MNFAWYHQSCQREVVKSLSTTKKDQLIFAFQKGKCTDEICVTISQFKALLSPLWAIPREILKICQTQASGQNFWPNPRGLGFPRIPYLNKFYTFHYFQDLIH